MSRYVRKPRNESSGTTCFALSSAFGIIVILITLFLFSIILSKVNATEFVLSIVATISLCIGGYVGGYVCARKRRRNGLIQGIICGTIIFAIVLLFGTVFAKAVIEISTAGKLILTLLCSGVGGIVGVNTKKRRY